MLGQQVASVSLYTLLCMLRAPAVATLHMCLACAAGLRWAAHCTTCVVLLRSWAEFVGPPTESRDLKLSGLPGVQAEAEAACLRTAMDELRAELRAAYHDPVAVAAAAAGASPVQTPVETAESPPAFGLPGSPAAAAAAAAARLELATAAAVQSPQPESWQAADAVDAAGWRAAPEAPTPCR